MKWSFNLIILCAGIILFLASKVIYNPTISIPTGYYFSYLATEFNTLDYVMLCVPSKISVKNMQELGLPVTSDECLYQSPYLAKQIIAKYGDYIDISNDMVKVNGVTIQNSQIFSEIKGIHLYQANLSKQFYVGKGQYFVIGGSIHSYDSRYFGLINQTDIYRKLKLIWHTNIYW